MNTLELLSLPISKEADNDISTFGENIQLENVTLGCDFQTFKKLETHLAAFSRTNVKIICVGEDKAVGQKLLEDTVFNVVEFYVPKSHRTTFEVLLKLNQSNLVDYIVGSPCVLCLLEKVKFILAETLEKTADSDIVCGHMVTNQTQKFLPVSPTEVCTILWVAHDRHLMSALTPKISNANSPEFLKEILSVIMKEKKQGTENALLGFQPVLEVLKKHPSVVVSFSELLSKVSPKEYTMDQLVVALKGVEGKSPRKSKPLKSRTFDEYISAALKVSQSEYFLKGRCASLFQIAVLFARAANYTMPEFRVERGSNKRVKHCKIMSRLVSDPDTIVKNEVDVGNQLFGDCGRMIIDFINQLVNLVAAKEGFTEAEIQRCTSHFGEEFRKGLIDEHEMPAEGEEEEGEKAKEREGEPEEEAEAGEEEEEEDANMGEPEEKEEEGEEEEKVDEDLPEENGEGVQDDNIEEMYYDEHFDYADTEEEEDYHEAEKGESQIEAVDSSNAEQTEPSPGDGMEAEDAADENAAAHDEGGEEEEEEKILNLWCKQDASAETALLQLDVGAGADEAVPLPRSFLHLLGLYALSSHVLARAEKDTVQLKGGVGPWRLCYSPESKSYAIHILPAKGGSEAEGVELIQRSETSFENWARQLMYFVVCVKLFGVKEPLFTSKIEAINVTAVHIDVKPTATRPLTGVPECIQLDTRLHARLQRLALMAAVLKTQSFNIKGALARDDDGQEVWKLTSNVKGLQTFPSYKSRRRSDSRAGEKKDEEANKEKSPMAAEGKTLADAFVLLTIRLEQDLFYTLRQQVTDWKFCLHIQPPLRLSDLINNKVMHHCFNILAISAFHLLRSRLRLRRFGPRISVAIRSLRGLIPAKGPRTDDYDAEIAAPNFFVKSTPFGRRRLENDMSCDLPKITAFIFQHAFNPKVKEAMTKLRTRKRPLGDTGDRGPLKRGRVEPYEGGPRRSVLHSARGPRTVVVRGSRHSEAVGTTRRPRYEEQADHYRHRPEMKRPRTSDIAQGRNRGREESYGRHPASSASSRYRYDAVDERDGRHHYPYPSTTMLDDPYARPSRTAADYGQPRVHSMLRTEELVLEKRRLEQRVREMEEEKLKLKMREKEMLQSQRQLLQQYHSHSSGSAPTASGSGSTARTAKDSSDRYYSASRASEGSYRDYADAYSSSRYDDAYARESSSRYARDSYTAGDSYASADYDTAAATSAYSTARGSTADLSHYDDRYASLATPHDRYSHSTRESGRSASSHSQRDLYAEPSSSMPVATSASLSAYSRYDADAYRGARSQLPTEYSTGSSRYRDDEAYSSRRRY